jgi:hypothetical protein
MVVWAAFEPNDLDGGQVPLALKFIEHAQSMLDLGKSLLIDGHQRPAGSVADNYPPAFFLIGDYSERRAGLMLSAIKLLRDDPTQIGARNPLLTHTGAPMSSSLPRFQS